jgi:hypothetical protein
MARFEIECTKRYKPIDIVAGRITVHATLPGQPEQQLFANKDLMKWMSKVVFCDNLFEYFKDKESAKFLANLLEVSFGRGLFGDQSVISPPGLPKNKSGDLTPFLHRVGTICRDKTAIFGRDGYIFVYEGGNNLVGQYQEPALSPAGQEIATRWVEIISERARYFDSLGVRFLQTIIPEKATVLEELFPIPIKTPTRIMSAVESLLKSDAERFGPCFASALDAFLAAPDSSGYYLKTDSHFSSRGAMATTNLLLAALAQQHEIVAQALPSIDALMARANKAPSSLVVGDLAMRFFDVPLYEEDLDIKYDTLFDCEPSLSLEQEFVPLGGMFNGLKMVWRHPDAPINLRVVAFGNSFFENGSNCRKLSWWFKHLCREFHFIWSREVDPSYIEEVRPDIVICQTIERFLPAGPRF